MSATLELNERKLAEIQARAALDSARLAVQGEVVAEVSIARTTLVAPAIDAFLDTAAEARIDVTQNVWVILGGDDHGIWARVDRMVAGIPIPTVMQVTDWVAWRNVEHSSALTTSTGSFAAETVTDSVAYEFVLVRKDGRVVRSPAPLNTLDSVNVRKVIVPMNAGVALPTLRQQEFVETVFLLLGHDEQERRRQFQRGGWLDDNGTPVFIEPAGAVTPYGYTDAYPMEEVPSGSNESGATSTDINVSEVENMLRRYRALSPNRPDLMVGTLGAMGAAGLALKGRTAFHIVGVPGTGKSKYVAAGQRFYTTIDRTGFNLDFESSSPPAIGNVIAQLPLFTMDDIRFNDGGTDDIKKLQKFSQNVYQQKSDSKAQQTGRNRETNYGLSQGVAISSSETLPAATGGVGMVRRLCIAQPRKGDIEIADAIAFANDINLPGNAVWGAYVRSLATSAQAVGLKKWVAENNQEPAFWAEQYGGLADTVAVIATGWSRFTTWLREAGVNIDNIITPAEVDASFKRLQRESNSFTEESDPVKVVLHRIREQLASGTAHAVTPDGEAPENAFMWGWTKRGDQWVPNGRRVAYYCAATELILITLDAIQEVKRSEGFTALTRDQIFGGLDSMTEVMNDRQSKSRYDKTAGTYGFQRKPGVVLPRTWLTDGEN